LGLLRNTAFAYFFGQGSAADAFNAAFKIPNALRNLLGEGTLSASFVPVYSRLVARGDERAAAALARAVLGVLLAGTSLLTLAGVAAAPWLTAVLAPGFTGETAALATRLIRILFPMSALMVVSGWCLGVQNSHRRFFWSYASAALWSVAQIALLAAWGARAPDLTRLAVALAWATLAGSMLQVGAQLPEVSRLVRPLRPSLQTAAEGVSTVLRNVVPVLIALGVVQLSSFIDLQIASYLPTGATSVLAYANTLAILPVSLFGVSIAASALPDLSRASGAGALEALRERVRSGWQRLLFYVVPSAVVLFGFGDYCVGILYRAGAFDAQAQRQVQVVLAASALGLVSFASVKLLASAHHALQDYRTPLRASMASLVVSAAGAVVLSWALRGTAYPAAGIALGSALGSYANLGMQWRGLRARLGALYTPAMWQGTRRIVVAAVSGAIAGTLARVLAGALVPGAHPRVTGVPVLAVVAASYLLVAWWMGSAEAARWVRRPVRRVAGSGA
jgi:putative peptidoglycan lipid II flippase